MVQNVGAGCNTPQRQWIEGWRFRAEWGSIAETTNEPLPIFYDLYEKLPGKTTFLIGVECGMVFAYVGYKTYSGHGAAIEMSYKTTALQRNLWHDVSGWHVKTSVAS